MNTLISIIIPAFNIGDHLPMCLDSILSQTYTNLEILVVNDGSKDHTAQVMEIYAAKDSRIRPIHKENGGVTSARLCGVREARGEWIGFVDGDDYIESTMFERLLTNAKTYEADISHCGYQMVFPNGRVDYYYNTGRLVRQDHITGLKDLVEGAFVEPGLCNKLYNRALFSGLLNGAMDLSIKTYEDLLMNYYLFKEAKCAVFEDVCPYHYMLRKGSAATSKINEHKLKDPLRVMRYIFEDTQTVPTVNDAVKRRMLRHQIVVATMSSASQKELIIPYQKDVRKDLRQNIGQVLRDSAYGASLKVMALWAAVWPWSYCFVHNVYARVTGHDKKYVVE